MPLTRRQRRAVAALLFMLTGCCGLLPTHAGAGGGVAAAPERAEVDSLALLCRVRTLAEPRFAGRGNGTPELLAAADTIAAWFRAAGLLPAWPEGYFQDFPLAGEEGRGGRGRNVAGLLPGRGEQASRRLVIGAHYDHLGLAAGGNGFHPGADDNASGVATLVELARLLAEQPGPDLRGVLLVAFAGEEIGLLGSAHFVREPPAPLASIDAMINLDTVGRLRAGRLYVGGAGTAAVFPGLLTEINLRHGLDLEVGLGGWDASDHVSFNAAGVPVLFLFTGAHEQYHTPTDDWTLVSPSGLARVAAFAADLAAELRARAGPWPHLAPAGEVSARAETASPRAAGERAWFGAVPDFVEGAGGLLLAGVMPGSPAAAAGLRRGDVIVGFAGRQIADLASFTAALRAHGPGDAVEVEVRRDGDALRHTVTLARRP